MTYRDLLKKLQNLSEEQLDLDVAINNEYTGEILSGANDVITLQVVRPGITPEYWDDLLDQDHPVISVNMAF